MKLKSAFIRRGWRVAEQSNKGVIGKIDHRGVKASVTIYPSNNNLLYSCKGTREIKKRQAAGGSGGVIKKKTTVEFCPKKWVENLKKDVYWMQKNPIKN